MGLTYTESFPAGNRPTLPLEKVPENTAAGDKAEQVLSDDGMGDHVGDPQLRDLGISMRLR